MNSVFHQYTHYLRSWVTLLMSCVIMSCTNPLTKLSAPSPSAEGGDYNPYFANPPKSISRKTQDMYKKGIKALKKEDYDEAEKWFQTINETHDNFSGPWLNLGIISGKKKDWPQAKTRLQRALKINPNNIYALNQLGYVYRHQGQFKESEKKYVAATSLWPNHTDAWLNLGVLYDLYLDQPKEAMKAYKAYQALQKTPNKQVDRWMKDLRIRHADEFKK